jgi:hypothetical protein
MAGGRLTLKLSPDRSQVTRVELALRNVNWTQKTETTVTQTNVEGCQLYFDGPFPIAQSGEFSVPASGVSGRFSAPDRASGTLQLVYHEYSAGSPGTPGTYIPGTPAIRMPDGSTTGGTEAINIPGIPAVAGGQYDVKLGTWKWSLSGMTAAEISEESRLVRQNLLRSFRYWTCYWAGPDERIEYVFADNGNATKIAETAWFKHTEGDESRSVKTTRSLLVPNAPQIFRDNGSSFAIQSDGSIDKLGDYASQSIKKPGADDQSIFMISDVDTDGKWIGRDGEKIIERHDDDSAVQIGTMEYRDIVLEAGASATKVLMTKGMEPGAAWEGEVNGVTYRQTEGGKPEPVEKLEYRRVKCEDGKDHLLMMAQAVKGSVPWIGVRDGTVYRELSQVP